MIYSADGSEAARKGCSRVVQHMSRAVVEPARLELARFGGAPGKVAARRRGKQTGQAVGRASRQIAGRATQCGCHPERLGLKKGRQASAEITQPVSYQEESYMQQGLAREKRNATHS